MNYLQIPKNCCIFAPEKDVLVGFPRISAPKTQVPIVSFDSTIVSFDSTIATFDSTIEGCDWF